MKQSIIYFTALKLSLLLFSVAFAANQGYSPTYIPLDKEHLSEFAFYKIEHNKSDHTTTHDLFNAAQDAISAGNLEHALELFSRIILANPESAQAYYNKGLVLQELKKTDEAIIAYLKALQLNPNYSKASLELSAIYRNKQDIPQAKKYLKQTIEHDRNSIEALQSLARLHTAEGDFVQAIDYLQQCMLLNSEDQVTRFELANNLNMINRSQEALEHYYYILKKSPTNSSILYNIGYTLKKLGKVDDAMKFYHEALLYNPEHVEAHFSLGLLYLSMGDFERGWPLYEWRWKRDVQVTPRNMSKPLWDGSSLKNKTIYVHAEQGYGDTFMFVRLCSNLKKLGAKVILGVQRGMVPILKELPYVDQVITLNDEVAYHDYQAPLLSLPYLLKMNIKDLPGDIPYVHVNPARDQEWKSRLAEDKNFKVGICFHGNDNYTPAFIKAVIAKRPVPLALLNPLGQVQSVSFYSLQKESGMDELDDQAPTLRLHRFDDTLDKDGRFIDTAAIIKNLDLVITVDTSIAHLAGGLGKPVWVLLPNPPDWRWMNERTDSPWYPTMRLFIQPASDDWQSVVVVIKAELEKLMSEKNKGRAAAQITNKKLDNFDNKEKLLQELAKLDKQLHTLKDEIREVNSLDDESLRLKIKLFSVLLDLKKTIQYKIQML